MADIRIKDLAVTASASSSDDYLAIDGSTNGTRKLSAYSPTFGGNLTVNGNISYQNTAYLANTATLSSGTKLTLDTLAQQGIDIFRNDANANYSAIRFRNSANSATNAQIGWNGTSLRLEGTPVEVTGNLTVSGGTVTSGSGTLTLNSSANTVVLQSAGTTALTIDSSQNATFAGSVSIGNSDTTLSRAAAQTLQLNTSSTPQFSLSVNGTQKARFESYTEDLYISTLTAGKSIILRSGNAATALTLDSSQNATFAGSIAINNTVQTAVSVASTHKVTISIGGSTYYLLATNV